MTDMVWVSKAIPDPALTARVRTDVLERDRETLRQAGRLINKGQSVPQEMCPQRVWEAEDPATNYDPKPLTPILNLFCAGRYWIVSAKAAEIIARFDLGGGTVYPVSEGVFEFDNTTPMRGKYFTWIFGNAKSAFLEQHSPRARPMSGSTTRDWCVLPWDLADGDIAVSGAALGGPDVWVDPLLFQSIFLSAELGNALDSAGLRHAFRLFTCRVV